MPWSEENSKESGELLRKIKRLMFIRLIFATFLLIAGAVVQWRAYLSFSSTTILSLYILTGIIYFLTVCYAVVLPRLKDLRFFGYLQLVLDVVFVTALIYVTGGIESTFSFLYILTIINAAIMLYRRGGMLIASASSILYGALLDLQYFGIILPFSPRLPALVSYTSGYYFYTILMNISAFYIVAFLSSYLAEELRRSSVKLQAKQYDLEQLELLNRNIVQSINTGIITLDNFLKVTYVNRAAENISGLKSQEMEGREIGEIFPDIIPFLRPKDPSWASRTTKPTRHEFRFRRRDEATIHLGFSQSVLKDPHGREFGLILIFQDLTELRRMEEQVRRMDRLAVVGELAAGIAHEIKNPLASLSGSIQVLRDELHLEPVHRRLMDIVLREAERLNSLVYEFLLFSKPAKAVEGSVDVSQVINDTLVVLQNSPEMAKTIELRKVLTEGLRIRIDPQQLQQVIWNLMLNAVQEMKGGGTLSIVTAVHSGTDGSEGEKRFGRISISDTGPGIPPENQDKIFGPFFTSKETGTGLGLTIVHRIVENYRGKIFLRSDHQNGTTFVLDFPLSEEEGAPPLPPVAPAA
ncbi:MAG TPA: ATP-binding protein [Syntrophobacteria bacterium]|nr:ATP-binding protein [Syntrophobacteria bacterium]